MTRVPCKWCGVEFIRRAKHPKQRFCSQSCSGKHGASTRDFSGRANPRFNGGWSVAAGRTVVTTRDGSYVHWYRVLLWNELGRPLRSDEIVHHINGDRTDDRLENLQVVSRAEHMAMHRDELHEARGITKAAA